MNQSHTSFAGLLAIVFWLQPFAQAQVTPTPYPEPYTTRSQSYLEGKWMSIGARAPARPQDEVPYFPPDYRLSQHYSWQDGVTPTPTPIPTSTRPVMRLGLPPAFDSETGDDSNYDAKAWGFSDEKRRTPTPTPTARERPPDDNTIFYVWKSRTDKAAKPPRTGSAPVPDHVNACNSRGIAFSDCYANMNAQGFWDVPTDNPEGLPEDAARKWWFSGSSNSSLLTSYGERSGRTEIVGSIDQSICARGGSRLQVDDYLADCLFPVLAHSAIGADPSAPESDWKGTQWFEDTVVGGQNQACIAPLQAAGPLDARRMVPIHDAKAPPTRPVPANVTNMAGTTYLLCVDNAKFTDGAPPDPVPFRDAEPTVWGPAQAVGGWIDGIIGHQAGIVCYIKALTNITVARGLVCALDVFDASYPLGIGNWIGLEIRSPTAGSITMAQTVGLMVCGGTANRGFSGNPAAMWDLRKPASTPLYKRNTTPVLHAGIVAQGGVVLGDGSSDVAQSGYTDDVTHIRDAIRIGPGPHKLWDEDATAGAMASLPPEDRTGILRIDSSNPDNLKLLLSVPASAGGGALGAYEWVQIPLEGVTLTAPPTPTEPSGDPQNTIEVLQPGALHRGSSSQLSLLLSGFHGRMPLLRWQHSYPGGKAGTWVSDEVKLLPAPGAPPVGGILASPGVVDVELDLRGEDGPTPQVGDVIEIGATDIATSATTRVTLTVKAE